MIEAKRYLEEIRRADSMIDTLIAQKEELYARAVSYGSRQKDDIRIKKSALDGDRMADAVIRYTMLEKKIIERIDRYIDFKDKVTEQIRTLPSPVYAQILSLRYLKYTKLEDIAEQMGYSYDYIRKLHGYALQMFDHVNRKEIAAYFKKKKR